MRQRLDNSNRIADILKSNLQSLSNVRGNIILNSNRGRSQNEATVGVVQQMTDPKIQMLVGKLHMRKKLQI